MTPELRELLKRHPAPWFYRTDNEDSVIDVDGELVIHDYMCLNSNVLPDIVSVINAAAENEVNRG